MVLLNWHSAEAKLNNILKERNPADIYLVLNVVAPLRNRLYNGERTLRLYKEIMNIHYSHSDKRIHSF